MDGWCGRDASWDCVNAPDGARWCAVEKDGQYLDGWTDDVEEMPVGIASMHHTVLDGAQWRKMVKIWMDVWCGRDASWDCITA